MMHFLRVLTGIGALALGVEQCLAACANAGANRWPMFTTSGWTTTKVQGRLTAPRDIILDQNGNMLVLQAGVGVSAHTIDSAGCVTTSKTIVSLRSLNHGLWLSPDGTKIYASSPENVFSWDYNAAAQTATAQKTIVYGMNSAVHNTRTLLITKQQPNLLIVTRGSEGNLDMPSQMTTTGRAMVKVFDLTKTPSNGYQYASSGQQFGYGLRNEVGICADPNGMVWGVENSADDLRRTVNGQAVDVHADNPAEELNYLGDPSVLNTNWYGYPVCFTVGAPAVIRDRTFAIGDQFMQQPNTSFNDATCAQRSIPSRLNFPAHTAPLDCKFDATGENLYVTFHGSWNRPTPPGPIGFKVVVAPMTKAADGSFAPRAAINNLNGFTDIMGQQGMNGCGFSSCLRPVGLAFNSKGGLYVSSDAGGEGELFLLTKN